LKKTKQERKIENLLKNALENPDDPNREYFQKCNVDEFFALLYYQTMMENMPKEHRKAIDLIEFNEYIDYKL